MGVMWMWNAQGCVLSNRCYCCYFVVAASAFRNRGARSLLLCETKEISLCCTNSTAFRQRLELTSSPAGAVCCACGAGAAASGGGAASAVANLLRLRRRSPPLFTAATPPASSRSPPSRERLRPADSILDGFVVAAESAGLGGREGDREDGRRVRVGVSGEKTR